MHFYEGTYPTSEMRPRPAVAPPCRKPAEWQWVEDVVVRDDPGKYVEKAACIKIHNQGSWVVRVNNEILLPDDRLVINCPPGGEFFSQKLVVTFLSAYSFEKALSTYPQLTDGKRLLISTIERTDL